MALDATKMEPVLFETEGGQWSVIDPSTQLPVRVRQKVLEGMSLSEADDALSLLRLIRGLGEGPLTLNARRGRQTN
jgi:hypothetical protein